MTLPDTHEQLRDTAGRLNISRTWLTRLAREGRIEGACMVKLPKGVKVQPVFALPRTFTLESISWRQARREGRRRKCKIEAT